MRKLRRSFFFCSIPGGHMYHHSGEAVGTIEPLDPKLSQHMKTLIRAGYKRPKVFQLRAAHRDCS